MILQKFRWSKVYESSEEELTDLLAERSIKPKLHHILELETSKQYYEKDATIWCAEGSMSVWADGFKTSMQPGDGLRIPTNTTIELQAGISGCVYYESIK